MALRRTISAGRRRTFALLALVVAFSAGCGTHDSGPTRKLSPPDTADSLLFVARSDSGSLEVRPGGESTLELDHIDFMTWFSDRPARNAGTSSVADGLEAVGWTRRGGRIGNDPPNATLVAAELGGDAVVIEPLTATVDGDRLRFTVRFITEPPESTALSDIDLFIDDTDPSPTVTTTPSGLDQQTSGGIVLGRTVDAAGQPHALVVHLDPDVERSLVNEGQLFAVISGTTTYSVAGDVAAGQWGFAVDPGETGAAAPIVVLKYRRGSLTDLAAQPAAFADPQALMDDPEGTTARLNSAIADVISKAGPGGPDSDFYAALAADLQDPDWSGVLVFDASVSELPGEVNGQSTAALADAQIPVVAMGFTASSSTDDPFFGTIDYAGTPSLRALFANNGLTAFGLGTD